MADLDVNEITRMVRKRIHDYDKDCECRKCTYWKPDRRPTCYGELAIMLFPHGHPELKAVIMEAGRQWQTF